MASAGAFVGCRSGGGARSGSFVQKAVVPQWVPRSSRGMTGRGIGLRQFRHPPRRRRTHCDGSPRSGSFVRCDPRSAIVVGFVRAIWWRCCLGFVCANRPQGDGLGFVRAFRVSLGFVRVGGCLLGRVGPAQPSRAVRGREVSSAGWAPLVRGAAAWAAVRGMGRSCVERDDGRKIAGVEAEK